MNFRLKLIADIDSAWKIAEEIKILKNKILADWENSSLELKYEDILRRFEDEYKGILRYFKKIYRDDRRSLQALSKNSEPENISDNDIIRFLNLLKEYNSKIEELNKYGFSEKIGKLYEYENTDWKSVRAGVSLSEKIVSAIEKLPQKLIEIICDIEKRHSLVRKINETVTSIKENQKTISEICGVLGISLFSDYNDLLFRVDSFLSECSAYEEEYEKDISDIYRFSRMENKTYSDEYMSSLLENACKFKQAKELFSENNALLCDSFGCKYTGINTNWHEITESLKNTEAIIQLLGNISDDTISVLCCDTRDNMYDKTEQIYNSLNDALLNYERCSYLRLESMDKQRTFDSVSGDLETISGSLLHISQLMNEIKPYCRDSITDLTAAAERVSDYRRIRGKCLKAQKHIELYLGTVEYDESVTYDGLIEGLKIVSELKTSVFPEQFYKTVSMSQDKRMRLTEVCQKLRNLYPVLMEKLDWINDQFEEENDLKLMSFSQSYEKIASCIHNFDQLEFWINFINVRKQCCKSALKNYIEVIEKNEQFDYIKDSFLRTFYLKILDYAFSNEPSLSSFKRNSHERLIENFRRDDETQLVAAQARLRSMLIDKLPNSNSLIRVNDEVSVLQKELNKRQKHMPLRKLFRRIPNLLIRLKPCLMMSPLSVSHFLEAETYNFDLVIFDEASQILPEDAIGAILRGKQVIIAGDIKQMPPTSFFSSSIGTSDFDSDSKEEEYDDVIAASILEEAAGTLPNKTLLWHYRSKNENLIAFSNREIYNDKLITFPNCNVYEQDMGVEYIYLKNGVYEGGGKNCNVVEAKECIKLLKKHIKEHPERSLGIIAFSEKQQGVIQREVDNFRIENPQYESFFESDIDEPFFVKNLENVQGDERDTIIFSICYAKDINGRLYMRFGPLGQQGGERRLNVAVTRAKCNIKLVGSLLPEELDLNRVKSDGVRMLRRYIEYAIHGEHRLLKPKNTVMFSKDEFCDIIADFITSEGFSIRRNVGCSANRVDIAVVDPENSDSYIAGIECDGYSYKSAKTARDRDSLRYSILSRMGWKMYRVWSTEWICNEKVAKEQLVAFLNNAENSSEMSFSVKKRNMYELVNTIESKESESINDSSVYDLSEYTITPYSMLKPIRGVFDYKTISDNIMCILSYEQPISLNWLYRRLLPSFGIDKMMAKYKTAVSVSISNELKGKVELDDNGFLWELPRRTPEPRVPSDAETVRKIEDISPEEIEELMKMVLSKAYGLDQNDLISECAAVFGYERRGARINSIMNAVVEKMKNNSIIEFIDGKIHMTGD